MPNPADETVRLRVDDRTAAAYRSARPDVRRAAEAKAAEAKAAEAKAAEAKAAEAKAAEAKAAEAKAAEAKAAEAAEAKAAEAKAAEAKAADALRLTLLSRGELADEFRRFTAEMGAAAEARGWMDEMDEALLRGDYGDEPWPSDHAVSAA